MSDETKQILLVDDEDAVASLGQVLLTRLGYEVVVTTRSHEALAIFQAAPQRFAMLITDQSMPGLTGIALAVACHQVRPDLPVILCTGSPATLEAARVTGQSIKAFLLKPFQAEELARTIAQVLA